MKRAIPIAVCASIALLSTACTGQDNGAGADAQERSSWASPSLTMDTVIAPNGAVTTPTQLQANELWGLSATPVAEEVTEGVYAFRGWGISSSFAIKAPDGWIIVDTGDSTRAAAEMREKLESAVGKKIRVAAILLTHWHYANGTGAWMDEGTQIWGHEDLDRNLRENTGVSVNSGVVQSRGVAQFGVFHPTEGPDSFPSEMRFSPEKLLAASSYTPPTHTFEDGKVLDLVIAGESVQVAPSRTDTSDSVAFFFPRHRLVVTNVVVTGTVFNIYSLRGGTYRDPEVFLNDAQWVESRNAEILLDIHGPTLKGEAVVAEAIERSVDQVQLIHDQTLRLIAHGMGPREAAEALYMPSNLRDGREAYGQVESHVRQVYNGTLGWFDGDVYEINPLSLHEEASRTIDMMGGVGEVRETAAEAAKQGGLANWRWSLKLTSMLLQLDPADAEARKVRADSARALGQRTSSANARGWYITEALENEGELKVQGQPVTMAAISAFLGRPSTDDLVAASVEENLQFVRYLVDTRKAEGKRLVFTIAAEGEPQLERVELRNGVLLVSAADTKDATHVDLTQRELAEFVLGAGAEPDSGPLAELGSVLDRSLLTPAAPESGLEDQLGGGPVADIEE